VTDVQYLEFRQYQILNHRVVPEALKSVVSKETYDKSQDYSRAKVHSLIKAWILTLKAKFGFLHRGWNQIINLSVIYLNVLPFIWELTGTWQRAYFGPSFQGEVFSPDKGTRALMVDQSFGLVLFGVSTADGNYRTSMVVVPDFCH
jgi:hypothetical protein